MVSWTEFTQGAFTHNSSSGCSYGSDPLSPITTIFFRLHTTTTCSWRVELTFTIVPPIGGAIYHVQMNVSRVIAESLSESNGLLQILLFHGLAFKFSSQCHIVTTHKMKQKTSNHNHRPFKVHLRCAQMHLELALLRWDSEVYQTNLNDASDDSNWCICQCTPWQVQGPQR